MKNETSGNRTNQLEAQSEVLREITLTVSNTSFNHTKMLGTEAAWNENGTVKDACGGDSGGPLLYQSPESSRWIIIGWLHIAHFGAL